LFEEIREKRGLVYSVSSFCDDYNDVGTFNIYAGLSSENLDSLIDGIKTVLKDATQNITEYEVKKVLRQYRASILMSRESTGFRARKAASDFITYGRYIYPEEVFDAIKDFDEKQASKMLHDIITDPNNTPTLAIYTEKAESATYINAFSPSEILK
jgi:predicted Zn-dependent peptidase